MADNSQPNVDEGEDQVLKTVDELLVDTIGGYPALWNKQLKEYHDVVIRENCWAMVAAVLNRTVNDCQKRWGQLRNCFTDERRKREKETRSGSGATKRKGFMLYNAMQFLQPHVQRKNTFTNVAPRSTANTTSTTPLNHFPLLSVEQCYVPPMKRHAPSTSTSDMLMVDIAATTAAPVFSFRLPPTPPSNTPPPPLSIATASTASTSATSHETSSMPGAEVSSCFVNQVSCGESSTYTAFDDTEYVTLSSTPPARTPTPGQISRETPASTPSTPRRWSSSPLSPYSPYTDNCSLSADDTPLLFSPSSSSILSEKATGFGRQSARPKACYNKENIRPRKVDPVEASFVTLSSVIQNHLTKSVPKEAEADISGDTEDAFGKLIAIELGKMDDETKKMKKSRLLQVLYE